MINTSNIINLNSYIRLERIRESFEKECQFVTSFDEVTNIDVYKATNIIFDNSSLKSNFYEELNLKDVEYTVVNCLASYEIFNNILNESRGIVVFDNVCSCKNNDILESVMKYDKKKILVC